MGNQRKIASQQGMGLLEIVIGLGVMTIIGLGMATLSLNANKAQKGIAQKNESLLVEAQIQGILSSSVGPATNCATNLFGSPVPLGGTSVPFTGVATPPALHVTLGGGPYTELASYTTASGLHFKQLRVVGLTGGATEKKNNIDVQKYTGSISVIMDKTAAGAAAGTGSSEFRESLIPFVLFVKIPGNTVYDCARLDAGYNAGLCADELNGTGDPSATGIAPKCALKSMSFMTVQPGSTNDQGNAWYRVKVEDTLAVLSQAPSLPGLYLSQVPALTTIQPSNNAAVASVIFRPKDSIAPGNPLFNQLILTPNGSKTIAGGFPNSQVIIDEDGFVSNIKFRNGFSGTPSNLNITNTVNIGNDLNVASVSTLNSAVISTFNMTSGNIASLTAGAITVTGSQTIAGNLDVTGNLTQTTGTLGVTSDIRLKTDIEPLQDNLAKILKIDPIKFQYIAKKTKEGNIGFSAQNVQEFFPELVRTNDKGYLSVAYANMTAVLVGAIKEFFEKWQTQDRIQTEAVKELALQAKDLERKQAERFAKLEAEIKSLREEVKTCKKK